MQTDFLLSLVIIFGVSALAVFLLQKIKIPSVIGFLLAGIIIGPHGISLIGDLKEIEIFAEVGVILLLFSLGIEFSLSKLMRMKRIVLGAGSMQIILTILVTTFIALYFIDDTAEAVFIGFLVALSSTAIVLKLLAANNETQTSHGRAMIGILLFQDLCVVLFVVLIPVLAGKESNPLTTIWIIIKAFLIVGLVIVFARWLVPKLFTQIVKTRSRELFIVFVMLLCFGTALVTNSFGLSLALGAFLAGMIVSESEYAHQATAEIIPFKESFMGLFFVSVGMLLNTSYLFHHIFTILLIVIGIIVVKTIITTIAVLMARMSLRHAFMSGLGLAQIGEFSFVLALSGKAAGLINNSEYQMFLSATILTMLATPFLLKYSPQISFWIVSKFPSILTLRHLDMKNKEKQAGIKEHVIIIGFGFNGRSLARVLKETGISYMISETNPDTVNEMKKAGEPIFFGDASGREILLRLGVKRARVLVCTVPDPFAQRTITAVARQLNPCLHIIVRTRFISSIEEIKSLGANEVIPEEFETAIEIFSSTLQLFKYPQGIISEMANRVRNDNYSALRKDNGERNAKISSNSDCLPEIEFDGYKLNDNSLLAGKTINELNLRQVTGVTVIAIRRDAEVMVSPPSDFRLLPDDIILFTGKREAMDDAMVYFREMTTDNLIEE